MRKIDRFAGINVKVLAVVLVAAVVLVGGALTAHQLRRHFLAQQAFNEGNTAFDQGDWETARKRLAYWISRHPDDLTANLRLATAALALRPLPPECIAQAMQAYRRVLRADPTHLVAFERLAQIYQSTGDFAELDHVAGVRLAALPQDPAATLELGRAQLQRKKPADSRATLTALIERAADNPNVRAYAVEACLLLATLPAPPTDAADTTVDWRARAVALDPDSALARVQLAAELTSRAAAATADPQLAAAARAELEAAERLVGPDPRVRLLIADQWLIRGEFDRAAAQLHAARTTDPVIVQKHVLDPASWTLALFDVAARQALASGAAEDGVQLADATLAELEGRAQRTHAMPLAVELLVAGGDLERARQLVEEYVRGLQTRGLNVDGPQVAFLQALLAAAEHRPFEVIRQLEGLEPATLSPRARTLLARACAEVGQSTRAARLLESLPAGVADPATAVSLARLHLQQGAWPHVRDLLSPRVATHPDDPELLFLLASAELGAYLDGDRTVDLTAAAQRLHAAREAEPDSVEPRLMLATLLEHRDGPAAAEAELIAAVADCTDPLPALVALAMLKRGQGRAAEALDDLRSACARFPAATAGWLALAELLAESGDLTSARAELARGLAQVTGPEDSRQLHLRLALLELLDQARAAGLARLQELARLDPHDAEVRALLLEVLDLNTERPAAAAVLTELARIEGAETIDAMPDDIRRIDGNSGLLWRLHLARYWLAAADAAAREVEVEKLLRRCIAADAGWSAPVLLLGELYERRERLADAETLYRGAYEAGRAAGIALRWVDVLQRQGRFAEALELYQRSGAPLDADAQSALRVRAALSARDLGGAIRELELRIAGPSATAEDLLLLAQLQYQQDASVDRAVATLARALERGAAAVEVARLRVALLRAANRAPEAAAVLDELVQAHPQPASYLLRGAWWLQQNEPQRAEQDFRALAEIAPDDSGYALLGDYYVQRDQLAAAVAAAETGLLKFPDSRTLKRGLAVVLLKQGQPADQARAAELLAALERADPADPALVLAQAQLALRRYQSGDVEGALEAYGALLARVPDHAEALNNVAWILAERGDELGRALDCARKAVALRGDDANFRDTLGMVLRKSGQLREARAEFLRGLELSGAPDGVYASLFLHAAETAAELNDWSAVREIAAQALGKATLTAGPERAALERLQRQALERTNGL